MPFDDVHVFRAITDQEGIHIQRTFDTRRNDLNNRVNFQTKQSDRGYCPAEHPFPGYTAMSE